jgi:hypothetical protein
MCVLVIAVDPLLLNLSVWIIVSKSAVKSQCDCHLKVNVSTLELLMVLCVHLRPASPAQERQGKHTHMQVVRQQQH